MIGEDRLGDVAAVERVARRLEPGLTAATGGRAFRIRHVLQRAAEVTLHEELSGSRRLSVREIDRGARRPPAVVLEMHADHLRHERMHWEAVTRESDRGGGAVAEAHRAEA